MRYGRQGPPGSLVAEGSGLHHVPPITAGVGLLCRLLTSVQSRRGLPRHALCVPVVSLPRSLALGGSPPVRQDLVNQGSGWYVDDQAPQRSVGQISPDKDMNFPCTTAAFTLSPAPGGLRHLVLTCPGTEPSMRFLSVGSHVCARASFRHPLAGLPLPSASRYRIPNHGKVRYSYRGLSPHQFMPMPGVHNMLQRIPNTARLFAHAFGIIAQTPLRVWVR